MNNTILIIEDNSISLELLKATLESQGYTVIKAVDGTSTFLKNFSDVSARAEVKIINANVDVLDVELVVFPFSNEEKNATYMIIRDITKRKRSTLHLNIKYAVAWILAKSSALFVATSKILNDICERIGSQLGIFIKRKHMEKQMQYLAEHDLLTGLSNRNQLEQYLNTALVIAKKDGLKLAVLFLDLDHFKYVNDSLGHKEGDILLKEVSRRLHQCLRPQDTISRLGEDEFIILLPNVTNREEVIEIIERLQSELSNQGSFEEKKFFITASIGISLYPDDGDSVHALIKAADIAMYVAKGKGRNMYQFCTPEMTVKAENKGALINDLRRALDSSEFVLYYQPKIDVITQTIVGMEALIRWKRAGVILLPDSFISAAEDSDLIIPISEWIIKTACLQNKDWQRASLPTLDLSINLSVRNLNKRLLHVMETVLMETKLNPNTLEIELTESAFMYNVENNIQILRNLKEMGLKISIDDFGTGYSSLSYLKRFPIDVIKIDKSFVHNIANDTKDAAIVTAIICMAHSLNFKVIAEGVENEAQVKFLSDRGCNQMQGFYFSRPLPAAEATQFLIKGRNALK